MIFVVFEIENAMHVCDLSDYLRISFSYQDYLIKTVYIYMYIAVKSRDSIQCRNYLALKTCLRLEIAVKSLIWLQFRTTALIGGSYLQQGTSSFSYF